MPAVANRTDPLKQSAIRSMTRRCRAVGGINIGQGLCQVPPPPTLIEAAAREFAAADHSYSPAEGDPGLLADLGRKLARDNCIDVDPATQIVVTVGATGALNATLRALLEPGDGVLLVEPYYGYHATSVRLFGMLPQPVRSAGPRFELDEAVLRAAVRPGTRAIVLCTPGNPSGRRLTHAELAAVAAVAERHDLLVITDEIYEYIYYDDRPHVSPAAVDGLAHRTVTLSGFSKTYSIPGWRLGYAAGPVPLVERIRAAADALSVCAPTPLQQVARHALALPEHYYPQLRRLYDGKRRRLTAGFDAAGLRVIAPQGAYYLFVDCTPLGVTDGWAASDLLLERAKVATIAGEAFHLEAPDRPYVRACFSLPDEQLDLAATYLSRLGNTPAVAPNQRLVENR
jgi:aminotransferase